MFERLLDDRRSLDDTFIVSARMRDVEKTLKNLDRAHKIRVRRRFADPRSTWHGLQTTSKIYRKIEGKFERKKDQKTRRKSRLGTPQNRRLGRPGVRPATPNRDAAGAPIPGDTSTGHPSPGDLSSGDPSPRDPPPGAPPQGSLPRGHVTPRSQVQKYIYRYPIRLWVENGGEGGGAGEPDVEI